MFKMRGYYHTGEFSLRPPFITVDLQNTHQKEVPTTANEFLVNVVAERSNIEEVTQCEVDYSKFIKNQSRFYVEVPLAPTADNLKPTKEWQNIQVADFSELRSYISRMLSQKHAEANGIKKKKVKNDSKWWRNFFVEHEPTLSCMLGFNATQVDQGLIILTKLLKQIEPGATIDKKKGRWIYAFLSCLKLPLLSDTTSIIRDLARQCATVRSKINSEDENAKELAAPLNLVICLVGRYYRQLDLADSFEL